MRTGTKAGSGVPGFPQSFIISIIPLQEELDGQHGARGSPALMMWNPNYGTESHKPGCARATSVSYLWKGICPQFKAGRGHTLKKVTAGLQDDPHPRQSRGQDWQELGKAYEINVMCFGCNQLQARSKSPWERYKAVKQMGVWGGKCVLKFFEFPFCRWIRERNPSSS